jgi:hypothetical protein
METDRDMLSAEEEESIEKDPIEKDPLFDKVKAVGGGGLAASIIVLVLDFTADGQIDDQATLGVVLTALFLTGLGYVKKELAGFGSHRR